MVGPSIVVETIKASETVRPSTVNGTIGVSGHTGAG